MIKNLIDAQLSKEDEDLAVQKVREMEGLFPFLVSLTPDERMALPKMGKKSLDFVERTLTYAKEHAGLIPPFRSAQSHQQDLELLKQLQRILGVIEPFVEMLRSTHLQLGAEAYASARDIYHTAKRAAESGVPGATIIARDLGERYKKQFAPDTGSDDEQNTTGTG
jgi:hypothetical protein